MISNDIGHFVHEISLITVEIIIIIIYIYPMPAMCLFWNLTLLIFCVPIPIANKLILDQHAPYDI